MNYSLLLRKDTNRKIGIREVVGLRNVGKFLQKFFENQRLFQWLFVKRTKISDKNLNIWNFSDFLKKLKIFVNKNTLKMKNIKMYPLSTTFFSDISATFWKIPAKIKMPTTSLNVILLKQFTLQDALLNKSRDLFSKALWRVNCCVPAPGKCSKIMALMTQTTVYHRRQNTLI